MVTVPVSTGHVILLVEDNPGDADLIRDQLADHRERPDLLHHAPDLAEAGRWLQAHAADAVLLDLRLPDGFGVGCIEAIRASAPDVPIVVLTGIDDERLALSCIAAGAQDYLAKHELRPQHLRRAIGYAIARSREAAERGRADGLQRRLAAIVESSSDAIVSTALDGTITSWNAGAERIFGYASDEAIGQPVHDVIRLAATDVTTEGLALRTAECEKGTVEVARQRRNGDVLTLSVVDCVLRDATGMIIGRAAIYRDVTGSRRRDQELRRRNDELVARERQMRALTARLHAVREEERSRMSREVHDELGQLLTGLKMDVRWVAKRLAPDVTSPVAEKLAEAERLIDSTVITVQRIALELRPSALDALGLPAAIRDEARRFERRTGIATRFEVSDEVQPATDVATAFFRIFQELLTNVARHAGASSVHISLAGGPVAWVLVVADNGVGMPGDEFQRVLSLGSGAAGERRVRSLGLLGIMERAESLGGTVSVSGGAGEGTMVTVRIPRVAVEDQHASRPDR